MVEAEPLVLLQLTMTSHTKPSAMDSANASKPILVVIGTMDTKAAEINYVANQINNAGILVRTIDVSTSQSVDVGCDISPEQLLTFLRTDEGDNPGGPRGTEFPQSIEELAKLDRSRAIELMSNALVAFLRSQYLEGNLQGAIGLGGSGGTALIAPALRALPIGVPKILVSTVASGNIAPYVGCSDVIMHPSIVDVAGLNAVSTRILSNAANALVGMATGPSPDHPTRPALAMTMFGVTTPCVTGVRQALERSGFDCLVFHATGVGGQAMEGLVSSGLVSGILDLTTTEVADEVVGGVFRAGPKRFDVLADRRIPCVLSVGAMDMVNFGALSTVPEEFRTRNLHIHNSNVTLMRTTPEENRQCARWIAKKLSKSISPVHVLLPILGLSALDSPGKPFHDPIADSALFVELEKSLAGLDNVRVERVEAHINDQAFIERAIEVFQNLLHETQSKAGTYSS